MPSRVEDYDVLYTIGSGSYGRCQKVRRKSDGKVSGERRVRRVRKQLVVFLRLRFSDCLKLCDDISFCFVFFRWAPLQPNRRRSDS